MPIMGIVLFLTVGKSQRRHIISYHLISSAMDGSAGERRKTRIAFLTSGGDSPGMNAAIRSIVRMAIFRNCEPYAVLEGLRGLVEGGSMIVPFAWNDVAHVIGEGGTIIRSSRCPQFMRREWRKVAARNLVQLGIDKLIVIGGDGSLTGADTFKREWKDLLEELVVEGAISREVADRHAHLMIVGLAGSIDNDMVGTETTIGADSSLHRIIEAIDCIQSTASSHQRAFVIEVMGRHCGWLALNAAISSAADWLLIPEDPPTEGWESRMCSSISRHRALGRNVSIVIVAEGAVDRNNQPIKSEYVRQILQDSGLDARVTTLGHIQRGGRPSAFDRYLGTMQGVHAVEAVLNADPAQTSSLLVGMNENRITLNPLMDCVSKTRAVAEAMARLDFERAFGMRDPGFQSNHIIWRLMHRGVDGLTRLEDSARRLSIGIIHCGAPAGGMNAATVGVFFYGISRGFKVLGICNGFEGLLNGETRELERMEMFGITGEGGTILGTNRSLPAPKMGLVAEKVGLLHLDALVIVGGFEGYLALLQLTKARIEHHQLRIPMVLIPATISNNVPGTEYSLGSDTALNVIVQSCDYIRQSATSSRKRVFVVDVHGGYCGYLATMSALAAGASQAYIHEEGLGLNDLQMDAKHLRGRFLDNRYEGRLIIRNEFCSSTYTAELISKILEEEGEGAYDSRWVVLGHLQQGGSPSPLDRVRAIRLAVMSMGYLESLLLPDNGPAFSEPELHHEALSPLCLARSWHRADGDPATSNDEHISDHDDSASSNDTPDPSSVVIGIKGPHVRFISALTLEDESEMSLRRPRSQWWMGLRRFLAILAKRIVASD